MFVNVPDRFVFQNYWNLIMEKLSPYIIHLRKHFYRNVNPYGISESLHDIPFVYIIFITKHNEVFFSYAVNNKTIVFGRHWFGGGSSGKLDP